jgi:hypothetical protein
MHHSHLANQYANSPAPIPESEVSSCLTSLTADLDGLSNAVVELRGRLSPVTREKEERPSAVPTPNPVASCSLVEAIQEARRRVQSAAMELSEATERLVI